ncbi:HpcH/HpaI aldolase/citrate lyase family protein [Falsirhodobacter xinxiangensis]|uniref:HpcH/HpaI aldolase/citrate lyase family protein n=1 Tax=Falsirhodobacter xinxiangensis TaxID=2530049 RepID=UPI0010AA5DC5|nr:CoA ester lyase [Rhodobacter xinxiangensis]
MERPLRSVLYIPASNERALEKAATLPCDAIIFDLEDAVAPDRKAEAREMLLQALKGDHGHRARIVRISAPEDAPHFDAVDVDAILVPKVDAPLHLDVQTRHPVWAMMETARGVLNAAAIAAHPRLTGMVIGSNDLMRELHARDVPGRGPLLTSLGLCVLAARANGLAIIDGVHITFRDLDALKAECLQGRDMGFDGKSLIHPVQIDTANEVFAPRPEDVDLARRQIDAHEAALRLGQAVAVVDGRIVENLHIITARRTLALAEAIAAI